MENEIGSAKKNNYIGEQHSPERGGRRKQNRGLNNFQGRIARKRTNLKGRTIFYNMALNHTVSKNYLWIFFFIKKFVEILKSNTIIQKMSRLKKFHYDIIGDKSFFSLDDEISKKKRMRNPYSKFMPGFLGRILGRVKDLAVKQWKLGKKVMKELLLKTVVFQPDHNLLLMWDFFMLFFLVVNIIHIPLALSFDLTKSEYITFLWYLLEDVPLIVFLIDIVINLNSSYYSKGVFISNRQKILEHYFKNHLWIDVLTTVPFIIGNQIKNKYLQMLMLFRIMKLKEDTQGVFDFFKLILLVFYLSHFCGCVWHYIAIWEIENGEDLTWLHHNDINKESWIDRYIISLYYSVTTMLTVGYGDITPQNSLERSVAIVMMVLSCGVFAYSINSVGNILKDIYKKEDEFKTKMADINMFMKVRNINKNLQMRVKRYVEYMYQEEKTTLSHLENVCGSLSKTLKEELFSDGFGKIIRGNPLLKLRFSDEFLAALTLRLHEVTLAPEDFVYRKGDDDTALYFVVKGEVHLTSERRLSNKQKDISLQAKKKGQSFGEISFFTERPRETSAKVNLVTHVVVLSKSDFLQVCKSFPSDSEAYFKIRDELMVYRNVSELAIQCPSCGKYDHTVSFCPLLIYKPHRDLVIHKHIKAQQSFKRQFKRSSERKKSNSRLLRQNVDEIIQEFKEINDDMIQEYLATLEFYGYATQGTQSPSNHGQNNSFSYGKRGSFRITEIGKGGNEELEKKRCSLKQMSRPSLNRHKGSEQSVTIDLSASQEIKNEKGDSSSFLTPQEPIFTAASYDRTSQNQKLQEEKSPLLEPKPRKSNHTFTFLKQKSIKSEVDKNNPEKTSVIANPDSHDDEADKTGFERFQKGENKFQKEEIKVRLSSEIQRNRDDFERYMDLNNFINDFERVKIYKKYYKNNNVDVVLRNKRTDYKMIRSGKTQKVQDFINKWGTRGRSGSRKPSEPRIIAPKHSMSPEDDAKSKAVRGLNETDRIANFSGIMTSPLKRLFKRSIIEDKPKSVKFHNKDSLLVENYDAS